MSSSTSREQKTVHGCQQPKITSGATYTISGSTVLDNGMTISGKIYRTTLQTVLALSHRLSGSHDWGTIGVADMEQGDAFATAIDITDDEAYDGAQLPPSTHTHLVMSMSRVPLCLTCRQTLAASILSWNEGHHKIQRCNIEGAQYAMTAGDAAITLKYAASNKGKTSSAATDEVDATSMAMVIGMGGATRLLLRTQLILAQPPSTSSGAAIAYVISDTLTVEAYSGETENDKNASYKFKDTGYGITYRDPGMTLSVTHNSPIMLPTRSFNR